MAYIVWKDEYSVGIEHINDQHKELVRQINILHEAMSNGQSKVVMIDILNALIEYTVTHFRLEEDLFREYKYPEYEKHKVEHEKFTKEVVSFKKEFESGRTMISLRLINFLKQWLVNHILVSDMEYKPFFQSQGLEMEPEL